MKNTKYYPIYLNISEKKCIVIGGGAVAERKVKDLLKCSANVEVAATQFTQKLQTMGKQKKITLKKQKYLPALLQSAFLVIAATNDNTINEKIFQDCRKKRILVNVVDAPSICDFFVPAHFIKGDIQIAISTGGTSPAFAKALRLLMKEEFGDEYIKMLKVFQKLRKEVNKQQFTQKEKKNLWKNVLKKNIINSIRNGELKTPKEIMKVTI